jgi:ribosomal protein L37AE/L43A
MVREPVNIPALKRARARIFVNCPTCGKVSSQVDKRARSTIWYCSACNVYHEATDRGDVLRSFRKEADQIINLPRGPNDGSD